MLGLRLLVLHNLCFYNRLMAEIRESLDNGTFSNYKYTMLESLKGDGN